MKINVENYYMKMIKNYKKRKILLLNSGVINYLFNSSGYVLIIVLMITALLVSVSSEFLIVAQTNVSVYEFISYD